MSGPRFAGIKAGTNQRVGLIQCRLINLWPGLQQGQLRLLQTVIKRQTQQFSLLGIQRQRRTASGTVTGWKGSTPGENAPKGLRCSPMDLPSWEGSSAAALK